jgi:CheY-like chemotaxis protein
MARILVVDDNDLILQTVRTMLERAGHQVAVAVNGRDGLRQLRSASFDLVITDILMPELEGMEMMRALRQSSSAIPIIAMTGGPSGRNPDSRSAGPDYLRMARTLGATQTIGKPFTGPQLLALVAECLSARTER